MQAKTFEIRDKGTFIPMLAVKLDPGNEADRYLLARAGYGRRAIEQAGFVLLCKFNGGVAHHDPYWWKDGTRRAAHAYIVAEWSNLESGAVIDVEFILGNTTEPKKSERETAVDVPA